MTKTKLSLDFKSTNLYALRLVLYSSATEDLIKDLEKRIEDAGDFYTGEAVVVDISELNQAPDWPVLIKAIKDKGLYPIGVQVNDALRASCEDSGLAVLDSQKNNNTEVKKTPVITAATPTARQTMIVQRPLRSGQSIYAKNSDLIVIGMVSQGAEIIADGNIHVYGPLRGKAIAGAQGDTKALILTTHLDPELLAIAGVYRVVETDLPKDIHHQAAKVELDQETLRIQALD